MRNSLSTKTVIAIVMLSLILSTAAIMFGFYLYSTSIIRDYRNKTWNISQTAATVIQMDSLKEDSAYVVSVYNAMSEAERNENDSAEYLAKFDQIEDEDFNDLRSELHAIQVKNSAVAGYIAALDVEHNRMIFITDGDPNETFCPPGHWDYIEPEYMSAFMNGAPVTLLDSLYGETSIPSVVNKMEQYGYRCTAGTKLFTVGGYPVFVFYDTDMNQTVKVSRQFLMQYILLLLIVTCLAGAGMVHKLKKNVVKPINELTQAAAAYSEDRGTHRKTSGHFAALNIKTGDEIEKLSETMKTMESDLEGYVKNLAEVTAEKERINTELNVAQRIQTGIIPNIFPAFPERSEFDIYATMEPAKEVGGDFYDFFLIDDDHLAMVIADVSGKGIPAALFMMASKILIGNIAKMTNPSPAEILRRVNDQICESNPAEMFVTVWLGILDLNTGILKAANAGHEYPIVKHGDGKFELLKDKHGFVLGGMKDILYRDYEVKLQPGDIIYQYTDGVTEANNSKLELYGTERLVDALNSRSLSSSTDVIAVVREDVADFAGDAEQFDDITMLCMKYNGKPGESNVQKGEDHERS